MSCIVNNIFLEDKMYIKDIIKKLSDWTEDVVIRIIPSYGEESVELIGDVSILMANPGDDILYEREHMKHCESPVTVGGFVRMLKDIVEFTEDARLESIRVDGRVFPAEGLLLSALW